MHDLDVRRAKRILIAQIIATMGVALIGSLFGPLVGLYALLGGATATIANTLFAAWVFGRYSAQEPGQLLARFYVAELIKMAFVAAAFAALIIWADPLSPAALFGAFFVVQVLPPLLANRVAR